MNNVSLARSLIMNTVNLHTHCNMRDGGEGGDNSYVTSLARETKPSNIDLTTLTPAINFVYHVARALGGHSVLADHLSMSSNRSPHEYLSVLSVSQFVFSVSLSASCVCLHVECDRFVPLPRRTAHALLLAHSSHSDSVFANK